MRSQLGGQAIIELQERWYSEIRRGRAFCNSTQVAAVAATYGHIQLFNPAASGVLIIVRAIITSFTSAQKSFVGIHNTALTTAVNNGVNLLNGGAAGLGAVRTQTNATQLGNLIARAIVPANDAYTYALDWFMELDAGEGCIATLDNQNVAMDATFFWIELPV